MNHFSIRDIENLSGIKAHTLRIWEQRFQLFRPKRKASKHRIYDNDDLKHVLRIAFLYNSGYKISKIAAMTDDEIHSIALDKKEGVENCEIFINQLMEAAIDFDEAGFDAALNNAMVYHGFEKTIQSVVFPLLRKIGLLWVTGHVIPAQEHFASALIINKILMAIDGLNRPASNGRKVLLFTPAGEHHEIPTLFMCYLLKKHGVATTYLGKDVDAQTIATVANSRDYTQLYFHLLTRLVKYDLEEFLAQLHASCPDKQIFFSLSENFGCPSMVSIANFLSTKEEMLQFVKSEQVANISH